MATPDHVRRLRERIGTDLLLLPSVSVLVRDDAERMLLVRHSASGAWGLVGGVDEVDEAPAAAAVRETEEETGLHVRLTRLVGALGGPAFRVRYPNGDEAAYVSIVHEARVAGGTGHADGDEVVELGWFRPADVARADLGAFAAATFDALGWPLP
jgi:ADP-ribose pyrophosphatase YjhB (NUDIX family)